MIKSKFIDTHIHLDLLKDYKRVVKYIEKEEIYVISMTNIPTLFKENKARIKSKYIRIALGFHPELIYQYKNQIWQMWNFLDETKYIGEVGLDLKNKTVYDKECQVDFFSKLIDKCDEKNGKVISIHSRGSENEILSILEKNRKNKLILHWYSGGLKALEKAIELGCYFSINRVMVNTKKGQEIIRRIPLEKLLTETDSPFTNREKDSLYVEDISKIIFKLSELKGISDNEMKNQIFLNFRHLIKL